jgi:hypothetical protein
MWEWEKGGATPPEFDGRCVVCGHVMQEMSHKSGPGVRESGEEKAENLHRMPGGVLELHAYKSEDLQRKVFEGGREIERPKTMASKRDRNAALGNAVVPQQIYPILAAIKQIDDALQSA